MLDQSKKISERHIKTHTKHSDEDAAAVNVLECFLRSHGRINKNFSKNDKWPNIDGTFEFVSNPDISRRPMQNFFVQIKGTHDYNEINGIVKFSLKSLAFPSYINNKVTLDPGILFVVLNPDRRGLERVFWKYMSADFLNSLDFNKNSATISFSSDEEILNTEESVIGFCKKLEIVRRNHSFVNGLSDKELSEDEINKIIITYDNYIVKSIDRIESDNLSQKDVSYIIIQYLYDLCRATLLLNSLKLGNKKTNLKLAWEQAMLNVETKYLATFLKGLRYIDDFGLDEGQSERLMVKYYNFLWQIRNYLKINFGVNILHNLEKFSINKDKLDKQYYELVAAAINSDSLTKQDLGKSRFYVIKKEPFFVDKDRYYEITLQLAGIYSTKYNRITVYTKENLTTNYSVQIGYVDRTIDLWGTESHIKVITNWKVSIEPTCLNKLAKILNIHTKITSKHSEYIALMTFLTKTGINLLDLIDMKELCFSKIVDSIYSEVSTANFKEVLIEINNQYSMMSKKCGRNTIRYVLLNMKEETLINVLPHSSFDKMYQCDLNLSSKCYPFEKNPYISNLSGSITNDKNHISRIIDVAGDIGFDVVKPYLKIKNKIKQTGEIFFELNSIASEEEIRKYNYKLDDWERRKGYHINIEDGMVSIDSYEKSTINILKKLLSLSKKGNKGQKEFNQHFIAQNDTIFKDELKKQALQNAFVNSHILLIYGGAGTGKTTLINYISNLMSNQKKLFLTKTHTAKQNLERRIDNTGIISDFISIDSFTKKVNLPDYDIIFIDECSIIDNRTMKEFLKKISSDTFLVLAGDIHQIEPIDFGNWFFYAKDIINTPGSNVELLNTWRTKDDKIIELWNEVRKKGNCIIEMLAINDQFSYDIGENIFENEEDDEIILCLNYDGKFGLNNMNNYFQNNNPNDEVFSWQEWSYKVGDSILFNDSKRFSILYNNLKGKIVKIEKSDTKISFTIDVATNLTENSCKKDGIEFIDAQENSTRIRFTVYAYNNISDVEDEKTRMLSVIPFQLAYAVSIHKAQGLEYDSVKIIIPKSNSERITHEIFYTAITRAKKKLKIYWSSETMNDVVKSFDKQELTHRSLDIIRNKLFYNN